MSDFTRFTIVKGTDAVSNIPSPPSDETLPAESSAKVMPSTSVVNVTVAGCGGCGINLTRPFTDDTTPAQTRFFDTSGVNGRKDEKIFVVANGSGSGSNRRENIGEIERAIPQLSDEDLGVNDVVIVPFSLAGGSGSVIGPLWIREYVRRKCRVVAVIVADTSSSIAARNTLNTLKTLTAICRNNNIYLPTVLLSNDNAKSRSEVDEESWKIISEIIGLMALPVFEVDRNDRLNFLNPSVVVDATPGIKMLTLSSDNSKYNADVVLGTKSAAMVDSRLILQSSDDTELGKALPLAKYKKTGIYVDDHRRLVGSITSDISDIEMIIDQTEKMENVVNAHKVSTISRLETSGSDDFVL